MLVHSDHPGNHRAAGEIHAVRAGGNARRAGGTERCDAAVVDDYRLVLERRRAGAIDDAHVFQRNHGRVGREERFRAGEKAALRERGRRQKKKGQDPHRPIIVPAAAPAESEATPALPSDANRHTNGTWFGEAWPWAR